LGRNGKRRPFPMPRARPPPPSSSASMSAKMSGLGLGRVSLPSCPGGVPEKKPGAGPVLVVMLALVKRARPVGSVVCVKLCKRVDQVIG